MRCDPAREWKRDFRNAGGCGFAAKRDDLANYAGDPLNERQERPRFDSIASGF
jgi:hypothetical protein